VTDPVVNLVLDTSVLCAYLLPQTIDDQRFVDRITNIIEAKATYFWPGIRVWIPSVVIAETQAVIDKFRHCDWHGDVKKDPSLRLTKKEYQQAFRLLDDLVLERRLDKIDHNHEHTLATALVSPINAKVQFFDESASLKARRERPMGATDCLIIASAMMLKYEVGGDLVLLVTADQRQCDIANRLRSVSFDEAREIGLDEIASRLGMHWTPFKYPRAVNLRRFDDSELRAMLHSWPLPNRDWTPYQDHNDFTVSQKRALRKIYFQVKEEYGIGVDKLPFTPALDDIRTRFAIATGIYYPNNSIYSTLQNWRKATLLNSGSFTDTRKSKRS